MKLSRSEKAVVLGVSVLGVGVAASAALIEYLDLPKTAPEPKQQEQEQEIEFAIKIPASKEEFIKSYAESYSVSKLPLSKIMKFVGQMLVAPIALKALDAVYSAYCDDVSTPQMALEQPSPPKIA